MKRLIGLAAMAAVSGCVSPYVGTPYERTSANIHTIAIEHDAVPEKLTAWEVASVGSNFGLIGALTDAAIQQSRETALMGALHTVDFDAEATFDNRLVEQLNQDGYSATVVDGADRTRRVFLTTYAASGADAYLDIVITDYGYIASGAGQPWRPTVEATVRLVRASDNQTLMQNQIAYNSMYVRRGVITLTPNPDYAFQNREAMLADPTRLAEGLTDALNQVADTAVHLLH